MIRKTKSKNKLPRKHKTRTKSYKKKRYLKSKSKSKVKTKSYKKKRYIKTRKKTRKKKRGGLSDLATGLIGTGVVAAGVVGTGLAKRYYDTKKERERIEDIDNKMNELCKQNPDSQVCKESEDRVKQASNDYFSAKDKGEPLGKRVDALEKMM